MAIATGSPLITRVLSLLRIGRPTTTERLGLPELKTAPHVDLSRYVGTWYELAAYPKRFQKDCMATVATYTARADGRLDVVNRCREGSLDGKVKGVRGTARVTDPRSHSKLEVRFFPLVWGAYWIVEVADDYSWAIVGHPSRDSLWILSRTPRVDEAQFQALLERVRAHGYPLDRLRRTPQRER